MLRIRVGLKQEVLMLVKELDIPNTHPNSNNKVTEEAAFSLNNKAAMLTPIVVPIIALSNKVINVH